MLVINKLLKVAIEASIEAGEAIMNVYETAFNIESKEDNSPLTEADKKANSIINNHLSELTIPIISEENKQVPFSIRKNWDACWIVDPVDGTKEFIKRNGEFTVNIALVTKGVPQLGVIYVPDSKTLYFADVKENIGFKAQLASHKASIADVLNNCEVLNPKSSELGYTRVVGSRSHMNQETLDFVETLKAKGKEIEIVSKGSSLKFCLIAEGNADVYPRYAPTMEWDTAAGHAICKAVGIDVISLKTNEALLYNKENLLNPWFLIANY